VQDHSRARQGFKLGALLVPFRAQRIAASQ
jgi:hypothetical protein